MDSETYKYLQRRFGDYYGSVEISPPEAANRREWGVIPWTKDPADTRMMRHQSLLDMGELSTFLSQEQPRHAYYSVGRYDDPAASNMSEKGWQSANLVFDLDADHLTGVDEEGDAYRKMLADCKDELSTLLDFLENDFGFTEMDIVFSGGRGYHVHVHDDHVQHLSQESRIQIAEYIQGQNVDLDELCDGIIKGSASYGRESIPKNQILETEGGWGRRIHKRSMDILDSVREMEESEAKERLQDFDGIGEKKAEGVYNAIQTNYSEFERGNIDVHNGFKKIVESITESATEYGAEIDEPVTKDTHRLIRLPGSLHGGSSLKVQQIPRNELDEFSPLDDAIPEFFNQSTIEIDVKPTENRDAGEELRLGDEVHELEEGTQTVPEYVGVFLMARRDAVIAE